MSPDIVFTLFYILISFGLIYPPSEFLSAGFTVQQWFGNLLGSEPEHFVRYHIRNSILNLFVYSCLPVLYVILLFVLGFVDEVSELFIGNTILWSVFASTSIILPLMALLQIQFWRENNFEKHPIVMNLKKFCNNNTHWETVASEINNEYRRLEKVCVSTSPWAKVIVTENWVLKVTPLTMFVAHQSDASLVVKEASNYQVSHMSPSETQFLNIEVKSGRTDPFIIRINATSFKDLENRLARTINILPNVKFHKSVVEQFVDVFKEAIRNNPRYVVNMELEQCIGCLQSQSEIKLNKLCDDVGGQQDNCTACFCRPMWCVDCIAKWFVSRQDPEQRGQWLSSKCTCPMCRATFCLLDVSLLVDVEI
ncbi:E3 ubiquitin-protein ligase TM129 [Cylas formicarius]|uniref:E3 ubiquitin-protein ligase TM129 n=1 Tax=Cylas formicarius TaxID=197179 RepID=UPI002958394E|nr:E3 ubiquitin-protein ligase TM129 [Cylas formicarius]